MKVRNLFSLFLKTPKGEIVMKATDTIDNLEELEHIPEDKKERLVPVLSKEDEGWKIFEDDRFNVNYSIEGAR